jgi:two-component system cell cycle sensor histidine kinase/response regulator CckA
MIHAGEILLIDDTPENLRVLGDLLRGHGLTVRVASSGAMALRSVLARLPDLILLDIRMPEMDGFETCRQLRLTPGVVGIPILFLSASDAVSDRVESFRVGGEDFISKPFQSEEVLARVTTHLALARTRRQLDLANDRLAEQVMTEAHLRSAAESVAAEGQVRLDLTLAAANMGTWEVDGDSGELGCDARARQILGLPPGQRPLWRDFLRLIPESGAEGDSERWERARLGGEAHDIEGWWTLPAAEAGADTIGTRPRRRIRMRGRPLPGRGGSQGQMVGVIWDVTDEHLMRERLTQTERLEALGLLAGGVAHDFNNQLAVIMAESEIIELAGLATAEARPHLANIAAAAGTSTALIQDLLAFARRRDVERCPLELAAVVRGAGRIAARSLGAGIGFAVEVPEQPIWVSGNAGQLENAILNLCINARDAMPDGGSLRLDLALRTTAGMRCEASQQDFAGTYAVITIADSGSGIPESIRGRIFEPFFTTKAEGKGTGLGLAAVLGCVVTHHGHLTLETASGRGTTFAIHLPLIPAAAPAERVPASASTRAGRLLLLDDQESVRMVIADGLRRLGWEVEVFAEAQAAITAWADASPRFAIALIDLVMPGLSGAKVFHAIRGGDPEARVVLMSGHTAGEDIAALRAQGLAGFVDKPVKLRQLAALLGSLIAEERP